MSYWTTWQNAQKRREQAEQNRSYVRTLVRKHGWTDEIEAEAERLVRDAMSKHLAAEIREALAQVERGEVVDLGSFTQHTDWTEGS